MNIKILFYPSKRSSKEREHSVILCRITHNKRRKQFSTGLFINPDYWNSKNQKVEPCEDITYINQQLSLIKNNLYQAFFVSPFVAFKKKMVSKVLSGALIF